MEKENAEPDKSLTHSSCETITKNHNEEDRGNLLIRGFWDPANNLIVDIQITNTYAKTYKSKSPAKVLQS